jgi:hypothetical protein
MHTAVRRALTIGPNSSRAQRIIDITTIGGASRLPRMSETWVFRVDGRWYLTPQSADSRGEA